MDAKLNSAISWTDCRNEDTVLLFGNIQSDRSKKPVFNKSNLPRA
ncbi:MAG: hypothetical protein RMY34_09400 [Aulosira sp. DedQUE10]|nr:hypothetical protein [Aulosira sp. DedQUE10]